MTNDIDKLKDDYRSVKAPPFLATRIRAEVGEQTFRRRNWVPAGATAMAIVAVAWLLPFLAQQTSTGPTVPNKPSLSAIASLKPERPQGTTASLAKIKTVKRPTMPAKPRIKTSKPQSRLELESDLLKEKDHVLS